MRYRYAALIAAVSLAGAVPIASEAAGARVPQAHSACRSATIGGKHKCIARGQFCAHRYASQYPRYGYHCNKRDRNGRWHLT